MCLVYRIMTKIYGAIFNAVFYWMRRRFAGVLARVFANGNWNTISVMQNNCILFSFDYFLIYCLVLMVYWKSLRILTTHSKASFASPIFDAHFGSNGFVWNKLKIADTPKNENETFWALKYQKFIMYIYSHIVFHPYA